jgi:predicted phage tail protein
MRAITMAILTAGLAIASLMASPDGGTQALAQGWAQTRAQAGAQTRAPTDVTAQQRRRVPRITVYPLSHYYRQCDFRLGVEHRPSGDVITPRQRCWWALR